MRYRTLLLLLTGTVLSLSANVVLASSQAKVPHPATVATNPDLQRHFGAIELTGIYVKNLEQTGMLRLLNANVTESLVVNGIANLETCTLNSVKINGSVAIQSSQISGPVTINGQMSAKISSFADSVQVSGYLISQQSTFAKTITLQGLNADFTDSTLHDITVNSMGSDLTPHIVLKGSKILGNVTFNGGNGIVTVDANSAVSGEIKGGTLQKQ